MNEQDGFQIDDSLVERLQALAREGSSVAEVIRALRTMLGPSSASALLIIRYFMKAFGLTLRDARKIEASHCMGNDAISDEELDSALRPLIMRGIGQE